MNLQHLEVAAGEDRTLTLKGRDASNAVKDLTGATISWRVGRAPQNPSSDTPIFSKTGTVTGASTGTFTVPVAAADTIDLDGDYRHEAWCTIAGVATLICAGRFRVRPALEA